MLLVLIGSLCNSSLYFDELDELDELDE